MGSELVSTRHGRWRGVRDGDLVSFLGIRYAAPPTGELRLRPPRPPEPHRGVRDATQFGPIAPQLTSGLGAYVPGDHLESDEDCLFLNVWTPACDDARRPVLVFFHGGAFLAGSGSSVLYRGDHLARHGVVLVTFNYRLGALGFLAHPDLDDGEGIGNWGLLDQLAALGWVADHIEGFGGDPTNVTVFGESAGAMGLGDLLGSARARGLFRRAILESGSGAAVWPAAAAGVAERFADALSLPGVTRRGLAAAPLEELLGAQQAIARAIDGGLGIPFRPVIDGSLLERHPSVEIASGRAAGVDLVVGTNRDEFKFFSATAGDLGGLDEVELCEIVGHYLEGGGHRQEIDPPIVVEAYRQARAARGEEVDPRALLDAFGTDWIFRIPALRLAEAQARVNPATFCYQFEWESPFLNGALGSCHGLELPFVFGTHANPVVALFAGSGPEVAALSETIQAAWVSFARRGDPSAEGGIDWPRFEATRRATMIFGRSSGVVDAPFEPERRFWQERLGRLGDADAVESRRSLRTAWLERSNSAPTDLGGT